MVLTSLDQLWYVVHWDQEKHSVEVNFLVLGFSEYSKLQLPLFFVFLTIHTVTVLGTQAWSWLSRSIPSSTSPCMTFSQSLILHWVLLFYCSYTQTIRKLGGGKQNHLLHRTHLAILLRMHLCGDRNVDIGSNGVWLICGHM